MQNRITKYLEPNAGMTPTPGTVPTGFGLVQIFGPTTAAQQEAQQNLYRWAHEQAVRDVRQAEEDAGWFSI